MVRAYATPVSACSNDPIRLRSWARSSISESSIGGSSSSLPSKTMSIAAAIATGRAATVLSFDGIAERAAASGAALAVDVDVWKAKIGVLPSIGAVDVAVAATSRSADPDAAVCKARLNVGLVAASPTLA